MDPYKKGPYPQQQQQYPTAPPPMYPSAYPVAGPNMGPPPPYSSAPMGAAAPPYNIPPHSGPPPAYGAPQQAPPGTVYVPTAFDAGARFSGNARPNIPPPPPGIAPNAAQMAMMQGQNVVAGQKKSTFMDGTGGGGYTFW